VAFFTWNAQTFAERFRRRGLIFLMAIMRPFLYSANRKFATRVVHTVLRGVTRDRLDLLGEEFFQYKLKPRLKNEGVQKVLELVQSGADVVLVSDGGPDRHAARRPVVGAAKVARFVTNIAGRYPDAELELTEINGAAALVLRAGGMPVVVTGEQHEGKVTRIYLMLNPDKLQALSEGPALMD